MKIGLNVISFLPGRMGGVESYFRNLLYYFRLTGETDEFVILCTKRNRDEFTLPNSSFTASAFPYSPFSFRWFLRGILKNALHFDPLSSKFDHLSLDVIHHPFTVLDPMRLKTPSVLTFW
ncbi:MAG: hypothetical protein WBX49_01185, partial [Candidatus Deferrimicrobiaceae bacterium]